MIGTSYNAVAACTEKYTISRLNLPKEKGLEVTAVLMKSKNPDMNSIPIIIFSIYSSPRSKYRNELLDFLSFQISRLKILHPKAQRKLCRPVILM